MFGDSADGFNFNLHDRDAMGSDGDYSFLNFFLENSVGSSFLGSQMRWTLATSTDSEENMQLSFYTSQDGASPTKAMTIGNGNVGIGYGVPEKGGRLTIDSPYSATIADRKGLQFSSSDSNEWWSFGLDNSGNLMLDELNTTDSNVMSFLLNGNVGINTTGPDRKLDILDASNPQLRLTHTDGSVYTDLQTDSSGHFAITPSGGVTDLSGDMLVESVNRTTGWRNIGIKTTNALAVDIGGSIGFGGVYNAGGSQAQWAGIGGRKENAIDSNYAGYLSFDTRQQGFALSEKMRITSTGNVGIGTTTPISSLHILDTSATTTVTIGDDTVSPTCLKLGDADGGGWTYCKAIDGALSCSTAPCDGN